VRFSHVDKSDLDREFSFVLDVSLRAYRGVWLFLIQLRSGTLMLMCWDMVVLTSTPMLPTLPIYVEELNGSRDVYAFIKQVRWAFEDLVLQGR